MDKIIEYAINKAYRYYYRNYYDKISDWLTPEWKIILERTRKEHLISFGGFEFSHAWYGQKLSQETKLDVNFCVNQHIIHLNRHFLLQMMGYRNPVNSEFTYEKFVETIAHEIAHCVVYDLYGQQRGHSEKQKLITSELREYLLTEESINILGDNWE